MPQSHHRLVLVFAGAPLAVVAAVLLAVVFALLGLPWWLGVLVGILLVAVMLWLTVRGAAGRLIARFGAVPLDETEYPRYQNLVEGLSLTAGLDVPDLYVMRDSSLNGAALASGDDEAIILTSGLLDACDRIELEGVLAGLLIRLKNGDAASATLAATLFGRPFESALASLVRPIARSAFHRLFAEDREIAGDREAVLVTRYPPGLAAALERIDRGPCEPAGTSLGMQHVWFAPPRPLPVVPHSPITWRLDVLSEI